MPNLGRIFWTTIQAPDQRTSKLYPLVLPHEAPELAQIDFTVVHPRALAESVQRLAMTASLLRESKLILRRIHRPTICSLVFGFASTGKTPWTKCPISNKPMATEFGQLKPLKNCLSYFYHQLSDIIIASSKVGTNLTIL